MNTAEIKLDLFRRIDSLPKADLKSLYNKFIALIDTTSKYKLNDFEKEAIEKALEESKKDKFYSQSDVLNEASEKYPNLKFK
jgi:hypothetical protein